ncbi:MAG TPA: hypothetical protein PLV68_16155, partial [Ilumatobacteraceae bacterium]|nr:hypothetical protein [Ilumatobacteraceae bacterium]
GLRYGDGTIETMSLGIFPIQDATAGAMLDRKIVATDRSQWVIDAIFEDATAITAGTNYADAIKTVITGGYPAAQFAFATTT